MEGLTMKRGVSMTQTGRSLLFILVVLCFAWALAAPIYAERLYPRDETGRVPDFGAFKAKFLKAVRERDAQFIYSRVLPETTFSYGSPGCGMKALLAYYNLSDPNDEFWRTAEKVMKYAGAYDAKDRTVVYPWLAARFPSTGPGVHTGGVIYGTNVNVRVGPSLQARVVDQLSFEVIELAGFQGDWVKIDYEGARHPGWVHEDFVHTPFFTRLGFKKHHGVWMIEFFVGGD